MQRPLALELIVYGIAVPVLSYLVYYFAPAMGTAAYLVGFTGGTLGFVWGLLGLAGFRRIWPAIVTLVVTAFGTLPTGVQLWMVDDSAGGDRRLAAVFVTLIFAFSAGLIAQIGHAVQGTFRDSPGV